MKDTARFSPLGPELAAWVSSQKELLSKYFESLNIAIPSRITAQSLDDLWVAWKESRVADATATDSFLNCFGVGFGQLLVDDLGFEWTYLEDEYGNDLAVRALPGIADTRVAPLHFVLKRWESGQERYVVDAISEIDAMVDEFASEHGVAR